MATRKNDHGAAINLSEHHPSQKINGTFAERRLKLQAPENQNVRVPNKPLELEFDALWKWGDGGGSGCEFGCEP